METLNKYSRSHIGEKHVTKEDFACIVVNGGTKPGYCIVSIDNVFLEVQYSSVKNGNVKNPLYPTIYEVGYLGIGKFTATKNRKILKPYNMWHQMIERVYSEKHRQEYPTYKNVKVCEEWWNYQNFAKWFYEESNYKDDWKIDKDILSDTNDKIYSPETCIFIPRKLNAFMAIVYATNTSGKIGAYLKTENNKWAACIRVDGKNKHLGYFDNKEDASIAYTKARESQSKIMKELYKDVLPKKVIDKIK